MPALSWAQAWGTWLSGWWSPEVSIVARADRGGGMRRAEAEMKRNSLTRDDMLAGIRTTLGGRAAETLYYGEAGLTTGANASPSHLITPREME